MFVYWGGTNSGKHDAFIHCLRNCEPVSQLHYNNIRIRDNIKCDDTTGNYKWEFDERIYVKNHLPKYKLIVEKQRSCLEYESEIKKFGIEPSPQIMKYNPFTSKVRHEIKYKLTEYTGTYKVPFLLRSIGVDKTSIIPRSVEMFNPKVGKAIINQVKKFDHIHIIPYRVISNVDSLIHKIQMWRPESFQFKYKDIFDFYEKNKDGFINYLSLFYSDQRDLESLLQKYNVKYEYYDMDTHDLASVTGLPKNVTHPSGPLTYKLWNLDDPDTKKRLKKAIDMCEDFLETTGLRDTRLEFRAKDGI